MMTLVVFALSLFYVLFIFTIFTKLYLFLGNNDYNMIIMTL